MPYLAHKSNTSCLFYIEVTTISAIRDTYPVATTTIAEDTATTIDLSIITLPSMLFQAFSYKDSLLNPTLLQEVHYLP